MNWWRRVFLGENDASPVQATMRIETSWKQPVRGDKAHGKTFLPGGPPDDPTPQWFSPVPSGDYTPPEPTVGMMCTIVQGEVLRRARVLSATKRKVTVGVEYKKHALAFTRRLNGEWREVGARTQAALLIPGIERSNIKSFKQWYSADEISGGWKL